MNKITLFLLLGTLLGFSPSIIAQKKSRPSSQPKPLKATVSFDKANALYTGIENPLMITAGSARPEEISTSCKKGTVKISETGQQTIVFTKPGLDTLVAVAPDGSNEKAYIKIKKLPDPVAKLGGEHGSGVLSVEALRATKEIKAVYDNIPNAPECPIVGYNLIYIALKQDPIVLTTKAPTFDTKIAEQIVKAKVGDYYMFSNILAKCPTDITPRTIAPVVINIK